MLAPWFRTMLVPIALPRLDGVVAKLEAGAKVADIGCGTGVALIEMAKAYPRSQFHGYDISVHALAHAAVNRREAGLSNVTFHDARRDPLPEDASFDLVTTFDCLHDMTHPADVMRAVRKSLKPDGTWLHRRHQRQADLRGEPRAQPDGGDDVRLLGVELHVVGALRAGRRRPRHARLHRAGRARR